ncbi:MAG: pyridoxamine 5'-phosphate oxidase family protein [Acidimicrobiales bacterium]
MSVAVELSELHERLLEYRSSGYLLTVGKEGRPHCVAAGVAWDGDLLRVTPGNSSVANAGERPLVSLLFPPPVLGDYSLIVDAEVVSAVASGTGGNSVALRPTKAVLHRPGTGSAPGCGSDCVPVYPARAV